MRALDYRTLSLPQIVDEARAIADDVPGLFGHLDAHQLNWQPAADSWSVAQCLEHLIVIDRAYYPSFDRIVKGEHRPSLLERLPVLPAVFGRMMVAVLSPESRRKYTAPATTRPTSSAIAPDIVARFVGHQQEILAWMGALGERQPATIVIRSPFAPIPYSVLDALRIIVAHERRHIAQARRVMMSEAFPSVSSTNTSGNAD